MPAVRLSQRRRKSSHALFTPAKAGIYGISARPVTFAPNVTPVTYTEVDPEDDPTNPLSSYTLNAADPNAPGLTSKLFPPSETPAPPPTRKRCPPGKRRSQGYIPRPPNAFMLFRADFVRQKHVPGSIETNHGSLSKIIGTCWRQLPLEDKRVWEVKARQEKAAHKAMFPDYRFRPVHNKNKHLNNGSNGGSNDRDDTKRKEKQPTTAEDERRCDEVAQLLLEGKKGEELARAVRNLDRARSIERERDLELDEYELGLDAVDSRRPSYDLATSQTGNANVLHMPVSQHAFGNQFAAPMAYHRRSSSVPLPNEWLAYTSSAGIALPAIPQFMSRPVSPVGSIARFNQTFPQQQQHHEQFTNPFQQNTFVQNDFQFAPIPEFTPTFGTRQQQQQQGLFHPSPQQAFMQTTPRSSLGLGHRRASSAQPMLMRSWTMPSSMNGFNYSMNMPIERDPGPLPDVDPELFANFSFGKSSSENTQSHHVSKPSSLCGDEVDPSSTSVPPTSLSHIDTSVSAPEFSMQSATSTSASTSSSGSPATSVDVLPDLSQMNMSYGNTAATTSSVGAGGIMSGSGRMDSLDMSAYMHLDGLYAPDSLGSADVGLNMGMYMGEHHQVYTPEQYAMGMYTYDVDPVVSSTQAQGQQGAYMHQQKGMIAPNATNSFAESYYEATA